MNPTSIDNIQSISSFASELALIAGVLSVVLWDLVSSGKKRATGVVAISIAAILASGTLSAIALFRNAEPLKLFYGLLAYDSYSHVFRIIFAIVATVIVIFAIPSPEAGAGTKNRQGIGEFFALLLTVVLGLNLMAMSRNLLMIYLSLELVSVISFVLAGFKINDRRSSEGALKYVVFGGMASGIMVYGMSWLYGVAHSLDLAEIAARVVTLSENDGRIPIALMVGVVCILAGFGYKISAAPFHMWTPDVYEGAPTSITAFLSVGPKAAGFAVLVRFFAEAIHASATDLDQVSPWAVIGGLIAIATMIVGNFTALHQNNVKRMLAYSSIAHAGYMLLGFCVFNNAGSRAIVFYLVVYALMNLGAFVVVAAVAECHHGEEGIETYNGLGSRSPLLAVLMAIFLFSLTGLPPFAGFVGKFYIFAALIEAGGGWNWTLAAIGVINSAVSLFYYAKVIRAIYLTKNPEKSIVARKSWSTTALALAIPTLALGLYWSPVYDVVAKSVSLH